MPSEEEWQPGALARTRALVRRALLLSMGRRGEELFHAAYHDVLRGTGHFGPPEDQTTLKTLGSVARSSNTIIDVGANVGRYAWFLRRSAPPHAALFALEPNPDAARLLRRTVRRLAGTVVLELAAGERDGPAELILPQGAFGSDVPALSWVQRPGEGRQADAMPIRLRRLDGLIEDGTIVVTGPVLLKVDVEGGEMGVLRGAADLLERYRPIVYLECQAVSLARQGETPADLWNLLEHAGYRLFGSREGQLVPMRQAETEVANYLALPDMPTSDADEPFDRAALDAIIRSWAVRPWPAPKVVLSVRESADSIEVG
jgi:FkbM family methyltransferase